MSLTRVTRTDIDLVSGEESERTAGGRERGRGVDLLAKRASRGGLVLVGVTDCLEGGVEMGLSRFGFLLAALHTLAKF